MGFWCFNSSKVTFWFLNTAVIPLEEHETALVQFPQGLF